MYYRHFGLAGTPFKFTTAPGALYFSAEHYEGLAALQWGFRERGGVMVLVGEIGTGKSTLIEWMLERNQDERVRTALLTNPTFTFAQMLQVIISQLRIHPVGDSAQAAFEALKTFLADPGPGDRVILIFDEAQGLSDGVAEQLAALSKLTVAGGQSLQIVLVGQPELEARLNDPRFHALQERIGFRSRLNPLRPGEVAGYVEHLLSIQGGRQEIFSPEALDEVARLSGGIPRMINMICHNALLLAFSEGATEVDARHVRAAMADFRILEEYEAVTPTGAFAAEPERRHRKAKAAAIAVGLVTVAVGVAFAIGLRTGRLGTIPGNLSTLAATVSGLLPKHPETSVDETVRNLVATVSGLLPKHSGASVDGSNENPSNGQPAAADANSAVSAQMKPLASASDAGAAAPPPSKTGSADDASWVGYPPAPAPFANALPKSGPLIASIPARTAAEPPDIETRHSIARELAVSRKIHRRRQRGRRSRLAERPAPAPSSWSEDDTAAQENDGAMPDNAAETDDAPVMPAVPVSPAVKSLVRAETREGDAHLARGDYDIALRKFITALVLDPSDDAVRKKIDRAEQAREPNEEMTP